MSVQWSGGVLPKLAHLSFPSSPLSSPSFPLSPRRIWLAVGCFSDVLSFRLALSTRFFALRLLLAFLSAVRKFSARMPLLPVQALPVIGRPAEREYSDDYRLPFSEPFLWGNLQLNVCSLSTPALSLLHQMPSRTAECARRRSSRLSLPRQPRQRLSRHSQPKTQPKLTFAPFI